LFGLFSCCSFFCFSAIFFRIAKEEKGTQHPHTTPNPTPTERIINVESIPYGAAIYFDGTYAGISPFTISCSPVNHIMKATLNGYNSDTQRSLSRDNFSYFPKLQRSSQPPPYVPPSPPIKQRKLSFQESDQSIWVCKNATRSRRSTKKLIMKVNTEGKPLNYQQIIKRTREATLTGQTGNCKSVILSQ